LWGGEKEEGRGGGDDRAQERILVDRRGEEMYDERIRAPPGALSLYDLEQLAFGCLLQNL
jgi:hypothetical protein